MSLASHPLAGGTAPSWACAWGEEKNHGVWAAFRLGEVEMRMRWVPPGAFWMGSPDDEPGRDDNETRHRVRLTRGFWMFETPCTQALYQEVMGENPSGFVATDRSLDRPVEQVSWGDAQRFCQRVAERRPDLPLALPTEAQWEYACRAGTRTATYAGPMEISGRRKAPVLDAIAWYGGNSGVAADEVSDTWDFNDWEEKQFPLTPAATHPVGQKAPNAWGLRDMLGNVGEWCADRWTQDLGEAAESDPIGPPKDSDRVVRGVSWYLNSRYVRSAFRLSLEADGRNNQLGFRCLLVPGIPPEKGPGRPE